MATHSSILAWRTPMDRGSWRATVNGVTQSWTRLKQLRTHACTIYKQASSKAHAVSYSIPYEHRLQSECLTSQARLSIPYTHHCCSHFVITYSELLGSDHNLIPCARNALPPPGRSAAWVGDRKDKKSQRFPIISY